MVKDDIIFYEYQRLKKWFTLLLFVPVCIIFIILCVTKTGLCNILDYITISKELIIATIIMLLFMINTLWINMKTTIDKNGIHIRMWLCPFYIKSKSFLWEDISDITIVKYNPILDYGGWGIRVGAGIQDMNYRKIRFPYVRGISFGFNSISYSISGNTGIQFLLQNKKMILIGTNKPEEVSEVIMKLGKTEKYKSE